MRLMIRNRLRSSQVSLSAAALLFPPTPHIHIAWMDCKPLSLAPIAILFAPKCHNAMSFRFGFLINDTRPKMPALSPIPSPLPTTAKVEAKTTNIRMGCKNNFKRSNCRKNLARIMWQRNPQRKRRKQNGQRNACRRI